MNRVMDAELNPMVPQFNKSLLIGCVSHTKRIEYDLIESIERATVGLAQMGWRAVRIMQFGNSDLCGARNTVFSEAYHGPFDKLLFVDSDVSWEPGAVERLVQHPVGLVFGAYRKKNPVEEYPVRTLPGKVVAKDPRNGEPHPGGIVEIAGGPAGMMMISRSCMDDMVRNYESSVYNEPMASSGRAWNVFQFEIHEGRRWTEDMNFCRKYRDIGGHVWLDPHFSMTHHGEAAFEGRFRDHLMKVGRMDAPQAAE